MPVMSNQTGGQRRRYYEGGISGDQGFGTMPVNELNYMNPAFMPNTTQLTDQAAVMARSRVQDQMAQQQIDANNAKTRQDYDLRRIEMGAKSQADALSHQQQQAQFDATNKYNTGRLAQEGSQFNAKLAQDAELTRQRTDAAATALQQRIQAQRAIADQRIASATSKADADRLTREKNAWINSVAGMSGEPFVPTSSATAPPTATATTAAAPVKTASTAISMPGAAAPTIPDEELGVSTGTSRPAGYSAIAPPTNVQVSTVPQSPAPVVMQAGDYGTAQPGDYLTQPAPQPFVPAGQEQSYIVPPSGYVTADEMMKIGKEQPVTEDNAPGRKVYEDARQEGFKVWDANNPKKVETTTPDPMTGRTSSSIPDPLTRLDRYGDGCTR
jgi:hypothetical protein